MHSAEAAGLGYPALGLGLTGSGLLGHIALHYNRILSWPAVIRVNKATRRELMAPWLAARCYPRDRITMLHHRCITCGWWSGRLQEETMCVGCGNSVVCIDFCTYVAYDGRRYCVECKRRPGAPQYKSYYDELVNLFNDHLNEMQLCGQHLFRRTAPFLRSESQCFRHGECKDVFRAWTMQVARKRMSEEVIIDGSVSG